MNFLKARVTGTAPLEVEIDGHRVVVPGTRAGLQVGQEIEIGLRPEHLRLAQEPGDAEMGGIEVTLTEHLGSQTLLYCRTAGKQELTLAETGQIRARGEVSAYFSASDLHVFDTEGSVISIDAEAPAVAHG